MRGRRTLSARYGMLDIGCWEVRRMIKVLIVEDHKYLLESLETVFNNTDEFQVVGGITDAGLAETFCERLNPGLIIMDICTQGGASGLAAAEIIREKFPHIKIILMTAFDEISYMPRAKEAGVHGFIFKSRSLDYFIQTAKDVARGELVFPKPKTIPMPMGEAPLTEREMAVLRLVCKHMSNKEIADELFISENTVKYHKANMLGKTGFTKTVDLAFYMISRGWINPNF